MLESRKQDNVVSRATNLWVGCGHLPGTGSLKLWKTICGPFNYWCQLNFSMELWYPNVLQRVCVYKMCVHVFFCASLIVSVSWFRGFDLSTEQIHAFKPADLDAPHQLCSPLWSRDGVFHRFHAARWRLASLLRYGWSDLRAPPSSSRHYWPVVPSGAWLWVWTNAVLPPWPHFGTRLFVLPLTRSLLVWFFQFLTPFFLLYLPLADKWFNWGCCGAWAPRRICSFVCLLKLYD